jgi:AcrR family transcriptional regulator
MHTKSVQTIAKIQSAAESLFLAGNYAEVTMDQIASESAVTKGGLYHHFASKEELYLTMMHADLVEKRDQFAAIISEESGCRERLARLTAAFLDLPREKRTLISLVRRDINIFTGPLREQLVRAYQAALPELVEEVIRDGIESGELARADARLLSWHFVAIVEVALSDYADKVYGDKKKKLENVLNLFFHGAAAGDSQQRKNR